MTKRFHLGAVKRLSGRKAFARVFAAHCSASNQLLVIYAAKNELPYTRIGLSVGRRAGSAVARNRIKRLLREAFRLEQYELPVGFDLVCVPRVGIDATLKTLRDGIRAVGQRAIAKELSLRNS